MANSTLVPKIDGASRLVNQTAACHLQQTSSHAAAANKEVSIKPLEPEYLKASLEARVSIELPLAIPAAKIPMLCGKVGAVQ